MNTRVIHIFYLFLTILLIACNTNNKENKSEEDVSLIGSEALRKQINVQNFFNTIPSAVDIFKIIDQTRLNYNPDYLNDPTKYKEYSLEKSRVLNLGVYGADLAISGVFNQTQKSVLFLKCTNYLAQELGISSAFNEKTMDRLENNKESRDSALKIISEAFKRADKIFTENKRNELSVLMIAGAFIESMYVAGEYALSKQNDSLSVKKIMEIYIQQDEALSYLINLLEITDNMEESDISDIKEKLKNIHTHLKKSNNDIKEFQQTHKLFAELRKQIINVY